MKRNIFSGVELSNRLDSVAALLADRSRITVVGGKKVLIEGNGGLLECSEHRMTVKVGNGKLIILGTGMMVEAMTGQELLIAGKISCVEWE